MNLYEIVGIDGSELKGMVFGQFTSEKLADKAMELMPAELRDETFVRCSNLALNTIEVDGKVIDLMEIKEVEDILDSKDENNRVEGYVQMHISDIIDRDYEQFLDEISDRLVGSDLLMDVDYDVVGIATTNEILLKVSGDVSSIIEDEEAA